MRFWNALGTILLAGAALVASCGAPERDTAAPQAAAPPPKAIKRITVAITGDPPHLSRTITPSSSVAGVDELEDLVHAGLANINHRGKLSPQLAEVVPSVENGLWRVFSDGRMETSWKIRPGAQWHDGEAFTSRDLVFTAQVGQDKELGISNDLAYQAIEAVEAPDPRTVVVRWTRPFIDADTMFTRSSPRTFVMPIPRHLLEKPYQEEKSRFTELRYWSEEFVGLGPYRLREFVRSSHLILEANERYVLGRPKIDEIEVKFITDGNALIASLLAGAVDMTLGRGPALEQAVQIRDQWKEGHIETAPDNWFFLWPQFINPRPRVVAEVAFRRALLHAIDRQQLAQVVMHGQSPVAHTILDPDDEDYREAERLAVRYDYDPARTSQLLGGLGYARGPDGILRDSANERLSLEIRSTPGEPNVTILFAIADAWKSIGIDVEPVPIPRQRAEDREYRANFPAFAVQRNPNGPKAIARYHGSQAPLPENRYVGSNDARYMNPEFDALIDRFLVTIPMPERVRFFGQIVQHMTDQLNVVPLFYNVSPILVANRITNVFPRGGGSNQAWNAQEWDLR